MGAFAKVSQQRRSPAHHVYACSPRSLGAFAERIAVFTKEPMRQRVCGQPHLSGVGATGQQVTAAIYGFSLFVTKLFVFMRGCP